MRDVRYGTNSCLSLSKNHVESAVNEVKRDASAP